MLTSFVFWNSVHTLVSFGGPAKNRSDRGVYLDTNGVASYWGQSSVRASFRKFFCRSDDHESVADDGCRGRFGDDHGDELRNDAGFQHVDLQWDDSDYDHELGCELDCDDGADGGNHGGRRGNRKRGGEQQQDVYRGECSKHYEPVADDGCGGRGSNHHRDKLRIDPRHGNADIQRDDGKHDYQLECYDDKGNSTNGSDDRECGGSCQRGEQQRFPIHGTGSAEHHEPVADSGRGGCLGDDHGHELRLDSKFEHREVQRYDSNDNYELGGDVDCGDGADGGDDRERCGSCQRGGQQRSGIHSAADTDDHESVADDGCCGRFGDDHGDELRNDAGLQHVDLQWDDSDYDHELGCELDCDDGADGGNHGGRRGNRKRGGEQQQDVYRGECSKHYEPVADDGCGGRGSNHHRDKLRIDPRHGRGER